LAVYFSEPGPSYVPRIDRPSPRIFRERDFA
jgi:hypothetical protein